GFSGHIPDSPQRAILRTQPPQSESLDANGLGRTHLVQSRHRVQKPDMVAEVIVIFVAEVWVECVAVEINLFFGVARSEPGILHGNALVSLAGRKLAFFRPIYPVVAVVAD